MITVGNPVASAVRAGAHPGTTKKPLPSPIDLTAAVLDSRVTYTGPAHFYWAKSGLLVQSAANEWPLEYRNGVAVGRTEPEPQITNWQVQSRGTVIGTNVVQSSNSPMTVATGLGPDGGDIASMPFIATTGYAVSQDTGSIDHVPVTAYGSKVGTDWNRLVFDITQTVNSRLRTWLARDTASGTPSLYLTQTNALTARGWVFSWFVKKHPTDATRFLTGFGQLEREDYPWATSPVVNAASTTVRAASAVTVAPGTNATGIRVYFTDGTTADYTFADASTPITLSLLGANWGTRYITKIEYRN